jgi:sugar lactone lactonase YvrE
VRAVNVASATVTLHSGSGSAAFVNGVGSAAAYNGPESIAVAPSGLIYVADTNSNRIRVASPNGTVGWLAGSGSISFVDGPPALAAFYYPRGIGVAPSGRLLYVSDNTFGRVRIVDVATGAVSTLVIGGTSGFADGSPFFALFNAPFNFAFDGASVLLADAANNRIRAIDNATGATTTFAGTGATGSTAGFALLAAIERPQGLFRSAAGVLYVAQSGPANVIRTITCPAPSASGTRTPSWTPGASPSASATPRATPSATPTNSATGCYVAPYIGTLGTFGFNDGPTNVYFQSPFDVAANPATGTVALVDYSNNRLRVITPNAAPSILTIAGTGSYSDTDGTGLSASFNYPRAVAYNPVTQALVVATATRVRVVAPGTNVVTTLAGSASYAYADGLGAGASFNTPAGLAVDAAGFVYVGDSSNHRVRRISPAGAVTTLAGSGASAYTNAVGTNAAFSSPSGLAWNSSGVLYVADANNHKIRTLVVATGAVGILCGGIAGFQDGESTSALFSNPTALCLDYSVGAERLFVSDTNNRRVRVVFTASRVVTTLVGSATAGAAAGFGVAGQLSSPRGITVLNGVVCASSARAPV